MKIKTFYGRTMSEALAEVIREFGDNALILDTRQAKRRDPLGLISKPSYQVTAAIDYDPSDIKSPLPPGESAARDAQQGEPLKRPPARFPPFDQGQRTLSLCDDEPLSQLKGVELNLRRLVLSLMRPWLEMGPLTNAAANNLYRALVENEVDEALALELVHRAQGQIGKVKLTEKLLAQQVKSIVMGMVSVAPLDEAEGRRIAIFVGPAGAGKTTTIAKLAARHVMERKGKALLLTMDTYRIAGAEQLRIYAGILDLPFQAVSTCRELEQALKDNADKDLILIDTMGCGPRDMDRLAELANFLRAHCGIEKHLVLSASSKHSDLRRTSEQFATLAPDKLLFTRLDETLTFGPILNELVFTRKPLSYLATGQRVPEDLAVPSARDLAELIVNAGRRNAASAGRSRPTRREAKMTAAAHPQRRAAAS